MKKSILRTVILKKVTLTDKLLLLIDDYSIYTHFIGYDIELGQAIESPIRDRDDTPSFCLFLPTRVTLDRPDEIWFKDMAYGVFGNVFTFVKYVASHEYDLELDTRYSVLQFIDQQMQLGLFDKTIEPISKRVERTIVRQDFDIKYKSRPYTTTDLNYWGEIGVEAEDLKHFKLKSLKYLIAEDGSVLKEFRQRDLAFFYEIWDKGKLYRPHEIKQFKFRNKCPGDDYMYYHGFEQLTSTAENLVITKSGKDVICFYKLFKLLGYKTDAISPHAESINLNKEFVELILKRYKRITVVADFDLAGVRFVQQCRRMGLTDYRFVSTKRIMINEKLKVLDKDISDFRKHHGQDKSLKLIKEWKLI